MDYVWATIIAGAVTSVWTGVLRWFPQIVAKRVERRIDHTYNEQLESLKHELEATRAAARSSMEFLAASQSEFRSKTIGAVESLWRAVELLEQEFMVPMGVDFLLTCDQLTEVAAGTEGHK